MAVVSQQAPIGSEQKMSAALSDEGSLTSSITSSLTSGVSNYSSLEQDDVFVSDLLSEKCESPRFVCTMCDEGSVVSARCRDCNESLCDSCVRAHFRVRMTKDHYIQRYETFFNKRSPAVSPPANNLFCDVHITEIARLYCETCQLPICGECVIKEHNGHVFVYFQEAIDNARKNSGKLLSNIKSTAIASRDHMDNTVRMLDRMNLRANTVSREIRNLIKKFHSALDERERELIHRVERIRLLKGKMLSAHVEELRLAMGRCGRSHDLLVDAMQGGSSYDLLQAKNQATTELNIFNTLILANQPQEEDNITFYQPDQALYNAVATMGNVISSTFANGDLAAIGNFGSELNFFNHTNNLNANILGVSEALLSASISPADSLVSPYYGENKEPNNPFAKSFRAKMEESQRMQLMLRSKPTAVNLSPFTRNTRNYTEAGPAKLTFGREGDAEGQLCRPWGVCCDRNNNIIVADRSNNRVQIFSIKGVFIRMFGKHGSEAGEFDRPAGVATDPSNRIVVADKDNHRIQVFTNDGEFVHKFGEKGSKNGQFNYPWDVDVDVDGRIIVSDTRNHRIQLFAPDGTFINKYGYENTSTMWKHFDSPRGVCFGYNGMVIVTDFNNHRLVLIDANFRNARFLGSEGSGAKEFLRPQGVAVDKDGFIVVADSRNSRIQVFESNGSFLWQFGESGKEEGQMDRPSGVCLTKDGQIVVVDFGNNRLQVF